MALGTPLLTVLCVACYFLVFWASGGTHLQFFLPLNSVLSLNVVYPYIEWKTDLQAYTLHYLSLLPPLPPAPSSLLLPRSSSPTPSPSPSFLPYLFPASPNPLPPNRGVSRELSSFGKKEWQLPQREYMCGGRAVPGESSWGNPLCPMSRW